MRRNSMGVATTGALPLVDALATAADGTSAVAAARRGGFDEVAELAELAATLQEKKAKARKNQDRQDAARRRKLDAAHG